MRKAKLLKAVFAAIVLGGIGWIFATGSVRTPEHVDDNPEIMPKPSRQIAAVAPSRQGTPASKRAAETSNQLEAVDRSADKRVEPIAGGEKAKAQSVVTGAPSCPRYPNVPVRAYRTAELAPKSKGGPAGELREWLVKPTDEGYEIHVEEELYQDENGELRAIGGREYVASQILVTLEGDAAIEDVNRCLGDVAVVKDDILFTFEKNQRLVAVKTLKAVDLDTVATLLQAVANVPGCKKAGEDFVEHASVVPNDTRWTSLWGMTQIKAPQAWGIRTDASSVVVAVLDSGINYNHEDLSGNMWINPNQGSVSGFTSDRYGAKCVGGVKSGNPMDDNGHGSHCAGTIGAVGDNGKGVAGVAWRVKLMALKCMDSSGSCTHSDQIVLMNYAMEKGADVISCSFGGYSYGDGSRYEVMNTLRRSGIVFACAAGNDTQSCESLPHYPSSYDLDNIVAVAASSKSDGLASFSNYGATKVDIAAPGVDILSCQYDMTSGYVSYDGTSMATPHVAGALAMIKACFPSESYLQIIQRLYSGGDSIAALNGKIRTGKRLNLVNAMGSPIPPSPVPTASKGTYSDKTRVSWGAVSGATHYRVWRANSATGTKTALGTGWQTSTVFDDTTGAAGTVYYYFAKSATSSSGANASDFSSYDTGWRTEGNVYPDAWDPNDNTASGTTNVLSISTSVKTQSHGLGANDLYDFAKVHLTAGNQYVFETTGAYDTYGELFSSTSTNISYRVAYNDDGGTNLNYKITYVPTSSGYYYLRTRTYLVGNSATYVLRYQQTIAPDRWDPSDDTASGGTLLTPTTSRQTHGPHTLSEEDLYDYFRIAMTAGRTYTFESTSADYYDMYGELFDSTLATTAHRVAYNDDGGDQALQFKISYTPTTTGTYYLRVRRYGVGLPGVYSLAYSVSIPDTHDLAFCKSSSWSDFVLLSNVTNAMTGISEFTTNDTIYVTYGFSDRCDNDIDTSFTNTIQLIRYSGPDDKVGTVAIDETVLGSVMSSFPNMEAGTWWTDRSIQITKPTTGYYGVRIELNMPRSISETNTANNVYIARYAVVAPVQTKTLESLAVVGPASVVGGSRAQYTATATFSDGTREDVTGSASWTIQPASVHASMESAGCVLADVVTSDEAFSLHATYTYNGVTRTASQPVVIQSGERSDPFGPAVVYPISPMTVYAHVMLDDVDAMMGDVLAAYVGDEVRGRLELREGGRGPINIYVTAPSERVTFKCWSRLTGDSYVCTAPLAGDVGGELGSPSDPYDVACYSSDPFGVALQYPNPPMTIVARVMIKGEPAARGDMVGVFCGSELRAKGAVRVEGGVAKVTLVSSVSAAGETLTFKVWDASEEELFNAMGFVSAVAGGELGSPESRYLIEVTDTVTQGVVLNSSTWQFVSFNVVPTNPTPRAVFSGVASEIDRVTCGDRVFKPTWSDLDNTLDEIAVGKGYWVKRLTSGSRVLSVTGQPGDVSTTSIRLAAGWNSIGYVPQQAGAVRTVFANALGSGLIDRLTSGDQVFKPTWSDGDNTLTTMRPGNGYWVKATAATTFTYVEPSGVSAAAALDDIAAEGAEHPFGEDRDTDVTSGVLLSAKLNMWGENAEYGDAWVAAYANGSTIPCCVAAVNLNGNIVMNIMKVPPFALTFKVWDSNARQTYTSSSSLAFSAGEDEKQNQTIAVSGTAPSYKVIFDLRGTNGGSGYRTGGGALTQMVARASAAVEPTVVGNVGYQFYLWDEDFSKIKRDTVVHAIYQVVQIGDDSYIVSFDANGGSGAAAPVVAAYGAAMPNAGSAPTKAGVVFAGYYDDPEGGVKYYNADMSSARPWDKTTAATLYAHWKEAPTCGAGKSSAFRLPPSMGGGQAIVIGVDNMTADDFELTLYEGNTWNMDGRPPAVDRYCLCFTGSSGLVDVEKDAVYDNQDDYWCSEFSCLNLAYYSGWIPKSQYASVDDVANELRRTYGADESWSTYDWIAARTASFGLAGHDIWNRVIEFRGNIDRLSLCDFLADQFASGLHLVQLNVQGHFVTCCGYSVDDQGLLNGLFIIDSDNDMFNAGGASNAPNRITFCAVRDGVSGWVEIADIFGADWSPVVWVTALLGPDEPMPAFQLRIEELESGERVVTGFSGICPENLVIPDDVHRIDMSVFEEVTQLRTVNVGAGVYDIGDYAFAYCYNLEEVTLGPSVTDVGAECFSDCKALRNVIVNSDRVHIDTTAFCQYGEILQPEGWSLWERLPERLPDVRLTTGQPGLMITGWNVSMTIGHDIADDDDRAKERFYPVGDPEDPFEVYGRWVSGVVWGEIAYCAVPVIERVSYALLGPGAEKFAFDTDAESGWRLAPGEGPDGMGAVRSGVTAKGGESVLTAMANASGRLTFRWKCYTDEKGYAGCSFTVKDASGAVRETHEICNKMSVWETVTVDVATGEMLTWRFWRGSQAYEVQPDCAWIADFSFGCGIEAELMPNGQSWRVTRGQPGFSKITIPAEIDGLPVFEIAEGAFSNCTELVEVEIAAVPFVPARAFMGCTSLKRVSLQPGTVVGESAFEGCVALETIEMLSMGWPQSVLVSQGSFAGCVALRRVNAVVMFMPTGVPSGAAALPAFDGCAAITRLVLVDDPMGVDPASFADGTLLLDSMTFGDLGLPSVAEVAAAPGHEELLAQRGLKVIGNVLYRVGVADPATGVWNPDVPTMLVYCPPKRAGSLLVVPETVHSVDPWAFKNCTALKQVEFLFPASDESMPGSLLWADTSFDGCGGGDGVTVKVCCDVSVYRMSYDVDVAGMPVEKPSPALPTFVRDGYVLAGWYTSPNGQGERIDGTDVAGWDWRGAKEIWTYWTPVLYDVMFEIGGAEGSAPGSLQLPYGSVVPLACLGDSFSRPGYELVGWSDGQCLHVDEYVVGTSNVTLTAVWRLAGLERVLGPGAAKFVFDTDLSAGWFSAPGEGPDGAGSMRSGMTAKGGESVLTATANASGTLAFRWKCHTDEKTYAGCTFTVRDTSGAVRETREICDKMSAWASVEVDVTVGETLTWRFWRGSQAYEVQPDCAWIANFSFGTKVWVKFEPGEDCTNTLAAVQMFVGETFGEGANRLPSDRDGTAGWLYHSLDHWYVQGDREQADVAGTPVPDRDVTLVAALKDKEYFVCFVDEDGETELFAPTGGVRGAVVVLPTADEIVAKPGYRLVGWTEGENVHSPGEEYELVGGDVTLAAVWEVDWASALGCSGANIAFETFGNAAWFMTKNDVSPDTPVMVQSGWIVERQSSAFSAIIGEDGTLAFSWRVSCDDEFDTQYAWASYSVNGAEKAKISSKNGDGWRSVTLSGLKAGDRIVWAFEKAASAYSKPNVWAKEDRVCLKSFVWTPDKPAGYSFTINWAENAGVLGATYSIADGDQNVSAVNGQLIEVPIGKMITVKGLADTNNWYVISSGEGRFTAEGSTTVMATKLASGSLPQDLTPAKLGLGSGPFASADVHELAKIVGWAESNGKTLSDMNALTFSAAGDPVGADAEAYLLNCAPNAVEAAKAAFKFTSFDPANPPTATDFDGAGYNGQVLILKASTLEGGGNWGENKPNAQYYKAKLVK